MCKSKMWDLYKEYNVQSNDNLFSIINKINAKKGKPAQAKNHARKAIIAFHNMNPRYFALYTRQFGKKHNLVKAHFGKKKH